MSKKEDIEDDTTAEYSSRYPCSRDSQSKLQTQNLPSKLGETLQIFNNYIPLIFILILELNKNSKCFILFNAA